MHYGIEVIPFGEYADPRKVVELAQAAEGSGWEAICTWDHMIMPYGVGDPWVTLSAIAATTKEINLITDVAALPRYRPQNLARLLTSLDILSQGRVILGAGAGAIVEEFTSFSLPGDARSRAEMLDESLQVLTRLWTGEVVEFIGKHFQVQGAFLQPQPVQQPRIPVWIGGLSQAAFRRAAAWDGWTICVIDENSQVVRPPAKIAEDVACIYQHRGSLAGFDIAVDGMTQPGEVALPREYADAGATWWFEALFGMRGNHAEMLARVKAGPPA